MKQLIAVVVSVGFAVVASSCVGVPIPKDQLTDPGALLFNGYTKKEVGCYRCHNGDGKGGRGPSLVERVPKLTLEEVTDVIKNGKKSMPKYGPRMTEEEITQLATWVKTAFP